jgi:hypothetical protein
VKFEYDIYTVSWGHGVDTAPVLAELNTRGANGWELVATTRDESPSDEHDEEIVMFVFKRPAAAKKAAPAPKKKKK